MESVDFGAVNQTYGTYENIVIGIIILRRFFITFSRFDVLKYPEIRIFT